MNFDTWFWTFSIIIVALVAYFIVDRALCIGKRGSLESDANPQKYTALEFNTAETTRQIARRASKTIVVYVVIVVGGYLWVQFSKWIDKSSWEQAIVLLGLIIVAPYVYGIMGAYDSAKKREKNKITRLQELNAAPTLFKRCRRIIFNKKTTLIDLDYPSSSSSMLLIKDSHVFFKDVRDGDAVFIFDTALEKHENSRNSTIVVYRESTDKVVKVGNISYRAKVEERSL
jgi:hypothetical protein